MNVAQPLAPMSRPKGAGGRIGPAHVLVPAFAVLSLSPFVSTGIALLAGVTIGIVWGNPFAPQTRTFARHLLALAVVGLGGAMDLRIVARVGADGIVYTVVGIAVCLALGTWLARVLRIDGTTGALIAIGTAICGGSAIAAVTPVLRPKEEQVSVALATVFLLNAAALFVFPAIGHLAHLDEERFGLWAALAIHDTSSVVGAAMAYGPRALEVATTVKLARALWIVPITITLGFVMARRDRASTSPSADRSERPRSSAKPWFIAGFLAVAACVTFIPATRPLGHVVSELSKHAMASTLFLIGTGLTRTSLRAVGVRPFVQGFVLWVTVAGLSLAALVFHVIG